LQRLHVQEVLAAARGRRRAAALDELILLYCHRLLLRARRRRRLAGGFDALHFRRQIRDLLLDRLELLDAADIAAPVGVDEPAARLGTETARLVVGLRIRDVREFGHLLRAD